MLTVRDLARDLDLPLLAGDDAADAPVRWVHISELADPTPWLSGGELLLTTGMGLRDDAGARAYVERLADHGLAGLGFGVGFDHDEVPEALLAAARSLALPVADAPEAGRRAPQAWLVAVKDAGGLSDFDRLLLHQAVTVVALELLRGRVADTTQRRLAGDVLSEIVGGALSGPEL